MADQHTDEEPRYTYDVPAKLVERQLAKVAKVNARAKRQGIAAQYRTTVEHYMRPVNVDGSTILHVPAAIVRVYGDLLRQDGDWTFAATVDWSLGEPMVRRYPGLDEDIELQRPATRRCDHCATERQRKDTYLVLAADGTQRQVGKDCLATYTGLKPGWVTVATDEPDSEWDGDWDAEARREPRYAVSDVLHYTVAWLGAHGYMKRGGPGMATRDVVQLLLGTRPRPFGRDDNLGEMWDEGRELATKLAADDPNAAAEVVAWVEAQDASRNEYLTNLQVMVGVEYVAPRHLGLLCSAVVARAKALEREQTNGKAKVAPGPVPTGKAVQLEGTVLSARWVETPYGDTHKMTLGLANGARVWCTVPQGLEDAVWEYQEAQGTHRNTSEVLQGATVQLVADVQASDDDPTFGFAKRPRKATLVAVADEEQAA